MNIQLYLLVCYLAIALSQPRGHAQQQGKSEFRGKWQRMKGKMSNSHGRIADMDKKGPEDNDDQEMNDNNYQYVTWSNDDQAPGYIKFSLFSSQNVKNAIERKPQPSSVSIKKPSVIINFKKNQKPNNFPDVRANSNNNGNTQATNLNKFKYGGLSHIEDLNKPAENMRDKACRQRVKSMTNDLLKNQKIESDKDFRGNSLRKLQEFKDKYGSKITRMEQKYNGIPVLGSEVVDHEIVESEVEIYDKRTGQPTGERRHITAQRYQAGRFVDNIKRDVGDIKPEQYNSRNALEKFKLRIKQKLTTSQSERASESRTVIYVDEATQKSKVAYFVSYTVDSKSGPPSVPSALMDVDDNVIREWDGLKTNVVNAGTGMGGNLKTGKYNFGKGQLRKLRVKQQNGMCIFDTGDVITIDLNQEWSINKTEPYSFTCPSNQGEDGINGAYSPLNDAHYYGQQVFELYKQWYGESPLDSALTLKVHYGNQYENAFWDSASKTMTFGDGNTIFYPLVALDVVAHEVSHGITDRSSKLFYWGESGALNEAFSDMAGKAAERFVRGPANVNWQVGYDITKNRPLRCMNNPTCDGVSVAHVRNYQYGMNVHYGSGIFNKVFYLMAKKMVFDVWDAFDIFYVANTKLYTSFTDFVTGAELLLRAAVEMKQGLHLPWGYGWVKIQHIIDSLNEVGLSCKPNDKYYRCEKVF